MKLLMDRREFERWQHIYINFNSNSKGTKSN